LHALPLTSDPSRPSVSNRHRFADALAGLRAHEPRYFKNKYDHDFTMEPASDAEARIEWVHRIRTEERDIVIFSRPLEATAFEVANIRIAYVLYESGMPVNVMYTADDPDKRRSASSSRRNGRPRRARVALQVRTAEVEAGRDHPRLVLRDQERVLTRGASAIGRGFASTATVPSRARTAVAPA